MNWRKVGDVVVVVWVLLMAAIGNVTVVVLANRLHRPAAPVTTTDVRVITIDCRDYACANDEICGNQCLSDD